MARIITRMCGTFSLGVGIGHIIQEKYKIAAYALLIASILLFVVYLMEIYCNKNR